MRDTDEVNPDIEPPTPPLDEQPERWRHVVDDDRYAVSSRGRVWSYVSVRCIGGIMVPPNQRKAGSPGYFRGNLRAGHDVTIVASTEPWETIIALTPADAR